MRFRSLVAVGALTIGLAAGSVGVASAVDAPPAPHTQECTNLVDGTSAVQTARANLAAAQATVRNDRTAYDAAVAKLNNQNSVVAQLSAALGTTLTAPIGGVTGTVVQAEVDQAAAAVPGLQQSASDALTKLQTDQGKVTTAGNDLRSAINTQTTALCTGTTPGTVGLPAPVGTLPTGVTAEDNAAAFALVNGDINALVCGNESGQLAKVRTDAQAVQGKLTPAQVGQLRTALRAKLDNLGCTVKPDPATVVCPNMPAVPATVTPVPATTDTTVPSTTTSTPLTLGSVPNASAPVATSGSQVGTVPEGAVATGDGSTVR